MIKYEDVIRQLSTLEKKKIKNDERIKVLTEENNLINSNIKILNQKKELFEKMETELSSIISKPSKRNTKSVSNILASTE